MYSPSIVTEEGGHTVCAAKSNLSEPPVSMGKLSEPHHMKSLVNSEICLLARKPFMCNAINQTGECSIKF